MISDTIDTGASPLDMRRFAKVVGMFGSEYAGERDAAVRQANTMLRQARLSWSEVLAPRPSGPEPDEAPRRSGGTGVPWREVAARCRAKPHALKQWERDFLVGIDRFQRLTAKQANVLREIARRVL